MGSKALERLEALQQRNADPCWVNSDLYRLLYQTDLYTVAYERIKSSPGNMTAGTDRVTLDGFSMKVIEDIIGSIRDESFQFKPSRREYIPKANGKMRPLGIPSPRDKVVQETMRMVLEAIYDSPKGSYFRDSSHGFRPNRSCHTALREFKRKWAGVTWIIEGDIKSCFDEIDHHVLTSLLRRKISDDRFINLVWKALRAGYMWMRKRKESLLGSPQGSVISPMLANVYLHELDVFVEGLKKKYEKGKNRKVSPEYRTINRKRNYLLEKSEGVWTEEIKELTKQMRSIPAMVTEDPNYVRVRYIRYADDWIVGVTGPKALADTIKSEIQDFLRDTLKLELSQEKTKITHAKTEEALFLGTRLKIGSPRSSGSKIVTCRPDRKRPYSKRATGWNPMLKAPVKKLVGRLCEKGFCDGNGYPSSKVDWVAYDVEQIINLFKSINTGLLDYYRFVNNFAKMSRIQYILRFSLAKTLAHKLRISMAKVFRDHGKTLRFQREVNGKIHVTEFVPNSDWTVKPDGFTLDGELPDPMAKYIRFRAKSRLGHPCFICESTDNVQMHHVRHIRKMGGKKPTGFTALMRALNRKQLPVCEECHQKIHRGEYDGKSLKDLAKIAEERRRGQ